MFGNIEDRTKLALVAPLYTGRADIDMLSIDSYITTDNMLQNKRGIIPYMGTLENIAGAVEYHCNDILVSNIRPYLKKNMVIRSRWWMFHRYLSIQNKRYKQVFTSVCVLHIISRYFF
mgnify:CR=1 FL=1